MQHIDRRDFCRRAARAAGLAAGAAAFGLPGAGRAFPASERLVFGAIGIGGRCSTLIRGFSDRNDVEFACLWPYMDKIAGDIRMGAGSPYWPQCATRIEVYGTEGLLFFGRHGGSWQVFAKAKQVSRPGVLVAEERGRFPDPEHQADFVAAIREGRLPSADIEEGHRSAVLVHLGNIATRLGGRRFVYDGKTETIPGDPEADRLLKREYRPPYVIPDEI